MVSPVADVLLGQSEVNHEDLSAVIVRSEEEVFWLDVSVDELA